MDSSERLDELVARARTLFEAKHGPADDCFAAFSPAKVVRATAGRRTKQTRAPCTTISTRVKMSSNTTMEYSRVKQAAVEITRKKKHKQVQ